MTKCLLRIVVILGLWTLPAKAQSQPPPEDILSVIPDDCWGFVVIRNLADLDQKTVQFFEALKVPPVRPIEMFNTRLNLGPQINPNGSVGVVFVPAESFDQIGSRSVLLFHCTDVDTLLQGFQTEKIQDNLWKADLVWGPTFACRKGSFVLLGSTDQSVLAVRDGSASIRNHLTPAQRTEFESSDIYGFLNGQTLFQSPALAEKFKSWDENRHADSILGADSIWWMDSQWLRQLAAIHWTLNLDNSRILLRANVEPQSNSTLAKILAFGPAENPEPFSTLPNLPTIAALNAQFTPEQRTTFAEQLDKLFQSEKITTNTDPKKLESARAKIRELVNSIQGSEWSLNQIPENQSGVLGLLMTLQVADSQAWLSNLQNIVSILDQGLFTKPQSNPYYQKITWQPDADEISGCKIHHLTIEWPTRENSKPKDATATLDYPAAWGGSTLLIQLAAPNPNTVLCCVGGYPQIMGQLLYADRDQVSTLQTNEEIATLKSIGIAQHQLIGVFSVEQWITLKRTLARLQDMVESVPERMEPVHAPVGFTLLHEGSIAHVEVVIPAQLIAGWMTKSDSAKPHTLQAPKPAN